MEVTIIGAGLAGLSAALTLAQQHIVCHLVSVQPSERAQSVLAEGGINAALDTMGEGDSPSLHREDTLRSGGYLAAPEAVRGLTEHAPELVRELQRLGVPFHQKEGQIQLRPFGGQKKRRTAYARSSTGKVIMTALIDAVRRYEAEGLVIRHSHHEFLRLILRETDGNPDVENVGEQGENLQEDLRGSQQLCVGVIVRDTWDNTLHSLPGPVILACGGMNGFFPEHTTGTTANNGGAAAAVFAQGVRFGNLEMLQYHPTTIGIAGKRCLVSEAARGEGGRLYILRNGKPWYFMEEKYPELGNLMPRDVVSREMYFVLRDPDCQGPVCLDMTGLPAKTWEEKLPDLRQELLHYLGLDPKKQPVPVEPGIHYFMGGIDVDVHHRTNLQGLWAAGECCCQYHGANRLGGNSMLGAIYGGRVAAEDVAKNVTKNGAQSAAEDPAQNGAQTVAEVPAQLEAETSPASPIFLHTLGDLLLDALSIVRSEERLQAALSEVRTMRQTCTSAEEKNRLLLAEAMLESAQLRRESRGSHYREDYPDTDDSCRRQTIALCSYGQVTIGWKSAGKDDEKDAGKDVRKDTRLTAQVTEKREDLNKKEDVLNEEKEADHGASV